MDKTLKNLARTVRPRQWLKNISLYTGLIFSGWLFTKEKFILETQAFLVFCLISSVVYILNDIIDVPKDRLHPYKKNRPIASGDLPVPIAFFIGILMCFIGLYWASTLGFFFFILCLSYILMNFIYSLWVKNVTILDVIFIAAGFILRVYAGAVAINAHINVWLLLCVVSFALFLAIGKRRAERSMLEDKIRGEHREVLLHYPENLLTIYTTMFATGTWLTYALFTFQYPAFFRGGSIVSILDDLPRAFISEKLLMITIPLVIYGVMRYLQLIYDRNQGDSPERVILSDKPLIITVLSWGIAVIMILYGTV